MKGNSEDQITRVPSIPARDSGSSQLSFVTLGFGTWLPRPPAGRVLGRSCHQLCGTFLPACCSEAEVPGLAGPLSGSASLSPGVMGDEPGGHRVPLACGAGCPRTTLAGLDCALSPQPRDHLGVPRAVLLGQGAALKGSPAPCGGCVEGWGCPDPPQGLQECKGASSPSASPCL